MRDGHTHYTPATGIAELRKAIASWYKKTYGLEVSPDQVIVSNGAKHSIHNVLAATVGPGDEVIIPDAVLGQLQRPRADDRRDLCPGADHAKRAASR